MGAVAPRSILPPSCFLTGSHGTYGFSSPVSSSSSCFWTGSHETYCFVPQSHVHHSDAEGAHHVDETVQFPHYFSLVALVGFPGYFSFFLFRNRVTWNLLIQFPGYFSFFLFLNRVTWNLLFCSTKSCASLWCRRSSPSWWNSSLHIGHS